jgi:hypothetical protein
MEIHKNGENRVSLLSLSLFAALPPAIWMILACDLIQTIAYALAFIGSNYSNGSGLFLSQIGLLYTIFKPILSQPSMRWALDVSQELLRYLPKPLLCAQMQDSTAPQTLMISSTQLKMKSANALSGVFISGINNWVPILVDHPCFA